MRKAIILLCLLLVGCAVEREEVEWGLRACQDRGGIDYFPGRLTAPTDYATVVCADGTSLTGRLTPAAAQENAP